MTATEITNYRRIVWVDDSEDEFQKVQKALEADTHFNSEFKLEFEPLDRLIDEDRPGLEELLYNPPEILLMDWNEGQIAHYYPLIQDCGIGTIILISANNAAELYLQQAFVSFPELKNRTLPKPFTYQQLYNLLVQQPKVAQTRFLSDILALRYLSKDFDIIGKSSGWKLSNDLIPASFSQNERAEIATGETAYHTVNSADPSGSGKFGPILLITNKIPEDVDLPKSNIPPKALYMQRAIELPPTGISLEQAGNSAQGIINLMLQSGHFKRGRFYSLNFIPGLEYPALEFSVAVPHEISNIRLPIAREIDADEREDYEYFCLEYEKLLLSEKAQETLIHEIREVTKADPFWGLVINNENIPNRLRIPVFRTKSEIEKIKIWRKNAGHQISTNLMRFAGIFVFDKGFEKKVTPDDVNAIKKLFLSVLSYFAKARMVEEERYEQKLDVYSRHFHKTLNTFQTFTEIEQALAKTAINSLCRPELPIADLINDNIQCEENGFSATYARYNQRNQSIDATFETDLCEVMKGIKFPLKKNTFPLQQCANAALKNNDDAPLHIVDFPRKQSRAEAQQQEEFKQMAPDRFEQWLARTEEIKALIAFPVLAHPNTDAVKLLGVLAIRAHTDHAFTRQNVSVIRRLLEIALPHLERCEAAQNHRAGLETAILHEERSHITRALAKVDIIRNTNTKEAQIQALDELEQILENQNAMSTTIMNWFGRDEEIPNNGTSEPDFWEIVDNFGRFTSRAYDELTWEFELDKTLRVEKAFYFERAIKITIDNAFRHADPDTGTVYCKIEQSPTENWIQLTISNPGKIERGGIKSNEFRVKDRVVIDQIPDFEKTVGLNLLAFLCAEVNAPLPYFINDAFENGEPCVSIYLTWPQA